MKMNKKHLQMLAALGVSAGLFGGYLATVPVQANQTIEAATSAQQYIIIKKNAPVYNKKLQKIDKVKKWYAISYFGKKTIKGKTYYKVDKNAYIRANVATKPATTNEALIFTKNSYIYNEKGKRTNYAKIKKGENRYTFGSRTIKGKLYYQVDGGFVNAKNATLGVISGSTLTKATNSSTTKTTSSKSTTKSISANNTEAARQRFLSDVNSWNAKKGRGSFTESSAIQVGSQARAEENATGFTKNGQISHVRPDGSLAFTEPAFNVDGVQVDTEVVGVATLSSGSKKAVRAAVDKIFDQFVNHDAASNWGHRDILTQGLLNDYTQMGIGVAQAKYQGHNWLILVANTGRASN